MSRRPPAGATVTLEVTSDDAVGFDRGMVLKLERPNGEPYEVKVVRVRTHEHGATLDVRELTWWERLGFAAWCQLAAAWRWLRRVVRA